MIEFKALKKKGKKSGKGKLEKFSLKIKSGRERLPRENHSKLKATIVAGRVK